MATADGYERSQLLAEPNWLWEQRDDLKLRIVDCGSPGAYDRTHIPGAVHLRREEDERGTAPVERFFADEQVPILKSRSELWAVLNDAGLSPSKETTVHCQAGVRTTMGVFVLSLLGWDNVRAYEASMAEWANRDDTPLVMGEGRAT